MYLLKIFYLNIISWVIPIGETEFRGNARSVKESVLAWSMKLPTHRKESLKKHAIHTMQKILIDSLPFFAISSSERQLMIFSPSIVLIYTCLTLPTVNSTKTVFHYLLVTKLLLTWIQSYDF
jgi:hypothetical protein